MEALLLKTLLFIPLLFFANACVSQSTMAEDLKIWKKAVVNIETEGYLLSPFEIDSLCQVKKDSGYSKKYADSLRNYLSHLTKIETGTAIYICYHDRKYLVTAKHVLYDDVLVAQKKYENTSLANHWNALEAIYPRISIRTPFDYYTTFNCANNFAIFINNFVHGAKPYFFISDSTGDGIGVISLQGKKFKSIDTLLQTDGYAPIDIVKIGTNEPLKELDEIYTIGFPEFVSVIGKLNVDKSITSRQLPDIVIPFVVKGRIAMYDPGIQHYYVDLTITPGSSGSPIIKNGKLVGVVSGINKYQIINESILKDQSLNLYGIGHLVSIINIATLLTGIDNYKKEEDALMIK